MAESWRQVSSGVFVCVTVTSLRLTGAGASEATETHEKQAEINRARSFVMRMVFAQIWDPAVLLTR